MFLWAKLVFDQIRESPSPEAIRESLQGAPEGLDDMLYHVFKRLEIDEQIHPSYLKNLLTWVFCAYRPFYVSELFYLFIVKESQHCYMIEDDLRTRYSSLFDVAGPFIEPSEEQEDILKSEDETVDAPDNFDFLDDANNICDDDDSNESEHLDDEENENQSQSEDTTIGRQIKQNLWINIPYHWHYTTVTFSHARIRDYLNTEGDLSTRRWHDSSLVPDNLNTVRLDLVLACLKILVTDIINISDNHSLKIYAKINWIKHLVEIDFTKLPKSAAVPLARQLLALFYDGHRFLQASFQVPNAFIETWFSVSKYSRFVRNLISEYIDDLEENQREWAASAIKSARNLFQPLMAACAKTWLTKEGWDDPAYLDKSEREVWFMYAYHTLVSRLVFSLASITNRCRLMMGIMKAQRIFSTLKMGFGTSSWKPWRLFRTLNQFPSPRTIMLAWHGS